MSSNYVNLTKQLNFYLTEKYPGITLSTDIFEHAFLRMLGYQFVPEKCKFGHQSQAEDNLSIYLSTPYEVSIRKFVDDLKICTTGEFPGISVHEIDPASNSDKFCAHLIVPYSLIEENIKIIFSIIDIILKDPNNINFYCYWSSFAKKYDGADLTIVGIENLIRKRLLQYLFLDYKDVWSFIIQEDGKTKFLKKQVLTDIDHFPKVNLIYEENGEEKEISLTRDKIVATLENFSFNNNLFDMKTREQEFILPIEITKFVEEKYNRNFIINSEYNYEIDLGYHPNIIDILDKKYGIKKLSSYIPTEGAERSHYYIYNKENYIRVSLALKEIAGSPCLEERLHQLTYYTNHQMWDKLNTELRFLVNLNPEVKVDYTALLMRLYKHAINTLRGEAQENTLEIIEKFRKDCVNKIHLQSTEQKKTCSLLLDLTLLRLNQLNRSDETEYSCLFKDLFILSQKAGLEESHHYLAELSGLRLGETFSSDVNENPIAVVLELANKHKHLIQENDCLEKEIAQLKAQVSLQESTTESNVNPASLFTLRK